MNVYALLLHEPYFTHQHPVAINATIINARTFLHPSVPQPGGRLLYRAFTDGRHHNELVPLSTVTAEVGGDLTSYVSGWEIAVTAVVALTRTGACDAMPLGLPSLARALMAIGPKSTLMPYDAPGMAEGMGPLDREAVLRSLAKELAACVARVPLNPGL